MAAPGGAVLRWMAGGALRVDECWQQACCLMGGVFSNRGKAGLFKALNLKGLLQPRDMTGLFQVTAVQASSNHAL
jgi:hypothetical protein